MGQDAEEVRAIDAIRALDEAGLGRGLIFSLAHLFASPAMGYQEDVAAAVRAENGYAISEARQYPDRLIAFVSVNPLHPGSEAEIRHWARQGARGIKLHMGSSGMDLRNPEHVDSLEAIFRLAGELRLPVAIHLRPQPPHEYGPQDARMVIERLLPAAGNVPVQIAHFGGGGGYDGESFGVMDAFARAVEAQDPGLDNLYFDLSGIVHAQLPDQVYQLIVQFSRRLGLNRIVMGSDWWGYHESPAEAYRLAREKFPFSEEEWEFILSNRAPYFQ